MANTFRSHPKFGELQEKGCKDDHAAEIATSVYVNLCEKHKWWNVELNYSVALSSPYIAGRPTKNAEYSIVIPCNVHQELNLDKIFKYFTLLNESTPQRITMALCEADLTTVYYNFNIGTDPFGTDTRHLRT